MNAIADAAADLEFDTADCTWSSVGSTLARTFDRNDYASFIASKAVVIPDAGFTVSPRDINPLAKPFQSDVARFALRKGRAGVFPDTGMGKTFLQLEIANIIHQHTGQNCLIYAPLAVGRQTAMEAAKFNVATPVNVRSEQSSVTAGITITNYEKMHRFDADAFVMVGLDEGSILKSIDGKTRDELIEKHRHTPYRYIFTATPSPNDITEIGSYAEFLGIMSRAEMLATFFTHDGGDTSKWRLRKWAEKDFFRWMASWAVMFRRPSELGYSDDGYILPPLHFHEHIVETPVPKGFLFQSEAKTLADQRVARRDTIEQRADLLASLTNADVNEPWVVWCNLNDESKAAKSRVNRCIEVTGSMADYEKESALIRFTDGIDRAIVSKPSICGFGLNWQHCCNMAFLGIDHSFEGLYQAVRRIWRFGQKRECNVHLVISDKDAGVLANIKRKQAEADRLVTGMVEAMAEFSREEIGSSRRETIEYRPAKRMEIPKW